MTAWDQIAEALEVQTGERVQLGEPRPVGGGSINSAWRLPSDRGELFVKINADHGPDMFVAEARGLEELHRCSALRIPAPLAWGQARGEAFLVMEYLPAGPGGSAADFGRALAQLHRITDQRFGWFMDNTIGSTLQVNAQADDWLEFWARQRLGFQLQLAGRNGGGRRLQGNGEAVLAALPDLLAGHQPEASLLHGDLWSGNYLYTDDGRAAIFDPAVYYGDREADLAMTELFGGFGRDFYAAYHEAWPLDAGYAVRKTLYNLYHIINHFNLFGGGYAGQAVSMMERLLSEVR